jgi:hypothetical protein
MTNVQGTKVLISDKPNPMWVDCADAMAGLQAGVEVLCPQSLGELGRTRATTENSCVSNNETVKAAGQMSFADFEMELLFDGTDILGQNKLLNSFESNKPIMLGLVAENGDIIFTEALISSDSQVYPVDGLIGYNVVVSPYGGFHQCSAASMAPKDCALSIGNLTADEFNLGGFLYRNCNIFKA